VDFRFNGRDEMHFTIWYIKDVYDPDKKGIPKDSFAKVQWIVMQADPNGNTISNLICHPTQNFHDCVGFVPEHIELGKTSSSQCWHLTHKDFTI
jgi:hypothetical protein